jgi:hypothetical protein
MPDLSQSGGRDNVAMAIDEFVHWLELRMGRKLKPWERGRLMEWLNRIMLELRVR